MIFAITFDCVLICAGGVSFFSGRYGFACNNIQAYEVVLGNGTIVTATATRNPQLFRALRGGSNNFGIVTRFDTKLFEQNEFWGGSIDQPITEKEDFFKFLANFARSETYDPYAALISVFAWLEGLPLPILNTATYTNGNVTWPPPTFKPLVDIPKLTSTVRKAKLTSIANEIGGEAGVAQGQNNFFLTMSFVNDPNVTPEYLKQVWMLVNTAAQDMITVLGLVVTMALQPMPNVLYSKDDTANVLGLDRFDDDLINLLFTIIWPSPLENDRVYARMRNLEADLVQLAKDMGIYNEWVYLNYASQWQDPIQRYGSAEVAFMKSVSKQYDPAGIFQKAVPGGFKLGI